MDSFNLPQSSDVPPADTAQSESLPIQENATVANSGDEGANASTVTADSTSLPGLLQQLADLKQLQENKKLLEQLLLHRMLSQELDKARAQEMQIVQAQDAQALQEAQEQIQENQVERAEIQDLQQAAGSNGEVVGELIEIPREQALEEFGEMNPNDNLALATEPIEVAQPIEVAPAFEESIPTAPVFQEPTTDTIPNSDVPEAAAPESTENTDDHDIDQAVERHRLRLQLRELQQLRQLQHLQELQQAILERNELQNQLDRAEREKREEEERMNLERVRAEEDTGAAGGRAVDDDHVEEQPEFGFDGTTEEERLAQQRYWEQRAAEQVEVIGEFLENVNIGNEDSEIAEQQQLQPVSEDVITAENLNSGIADDDTLSVEEKRRMYDEHVLQQQARIRELERERTELLEHQRMLLEQQERARVLLQGVNHERDCAMARRGRNTAVLDEVNRLARDREIQENTTGGTNTENDHDTAVRLGAIEQQLSIDNYENEMNSTGLGRFSGANHDTAPRNPLIPRTGELESKATAFTVAGILQKVLNYSGKKAIKSEPINPVIPLKENEKPINFLQLSQFVPLEYLLAFLPAVDLLSLSLVSHYFCAVCFCSQAWFRHFHGKSCGVLQNTDDSLSQLDYPKFKERGAGNDNNRNDPQYQIAEPWGNIEVNQTITVITRNQDQQHQLTDGSENSTDIVSTEERPIPRLEKPSILLFSTFAESAVKVRESMDSLTPLLKALTLSAVAPLPRLTKDLGRLARLKKRENWKNAVGIMQEGIDEVTLAVAEKEVEDKKLLEEEKQAVAALENDMISTDVGTTTDLVSSTTDIETQGTATDTPIETAVTATKNDDILDRTIVATENIGIEMDRLDAANAVDNQATEQSVSEQSKNNDIDTENAVAALTDLLMPSSITPGINSEVNDALFPITSKQQALAQECIKIHKLLELAQNLRKNAILVKRNMVKNNCDETTGSGNLKYSGDGVNTEKTEDYELSFEEESDLLHEQIKFSLVRLTYLRSIMHLLSRSFEKVQVQLEFWKLAAVELEDTGISAYPLQGLKVVLNELVLPVTKLLKSSLGMATRADAALGQIKKRAVWIIEGGELEKSGKGNDIISDSTAPSIPSLQHVTDTTVTTTTKGETVVENNPLKQMLLAESNAYEKTVLEGLISEEEGPEGSRETKEIGADNDGELGLGGGETSNSGVVNDISNSNFLNLLTPAAVSGSADAGGGNTFDT